MKIPTIAAGSGIAAAAIGRPGRAGAATLVSACEAEVVPDWVDRLAGADIFTADHCYKIIESLRID